MCMLNYRPHQLIRNSASLAHYIFIDIVQELFQGTRVISGDKSYFRGQELFQGARGDFTPFPGFCCPPLDLAYSL